MGITKKQKEVRKLNVITAKTANGVEIRLQRISKKEINASRSKAYKYLFV